MKKHWVLYSLIMLFGCDNAKRIEAYQPNIEIVKTYLTGGEKKQHFFSRYAPFILSPPPTSKEQTIAAVKAWSKQTKQEVTELRKTHPEFMLSYYLYEQTDELTPDFKEYLDPYFFGTGENMIGIKDVGKGHKIASISWSEWGCRINIYIEMYHYGWFGTTEELFYEKHVEGAESGAPGCEKKE